MSAQDQSTRTWLAAQLATLPPDERAVYRAIAVDGLDYAKAARQLGLSSQAVEQALARALSALARAAPP